MEITKMGKGKRVKKWIGEAIQKPGALTDYVRAKFGEKGFTARGTIKVSLLHELARGLHGATKRTQARSRLALKLRKMKRRK